MTQIAKLYSRILANPRVPIPFRDFERLLAAFGFKCERIRGSHRVFGHPRVDQLLIVQPLGKEAKPYQVRQFLDIIEQFDLTLED